MAASRTARRAPAAPVRARPARRSSPAVASSTARTPRDYAQRTPKKMKAAALRGALSDRARDGRVHVVDRRSSTGDTPSTKAAVAALARIVRPPPRARGRSSATTTSPGRACATSTACTCSSPDQLNTYDVLVSDDVVFTQGALEAFLAGPTRGKGAKAVATEPRPSCRATPTSRSDGMTQDRRPARHPARAGRLREELRPARREQVHVPRRARTPTRPQIKIAVEQVFDVKVTDVNTLNRQGKRKRTRAGFGKRKDTKRAIVSLRRRRPHRHLRRAGRLTGGRARRD